MSVTIRCKDGWKLVLAKADRVSPTLLQSIAEDHPDPVVEEDD